MNETSKTSVTKSEDAVIVPIYDICYDPIYSNSDIIDASSGFQHNIEPTHPVAVNLFASHVKQCSSNNKLTFQEQFKVYMYTAVCMQLD